MPSPGKAEGPPQQCGQPSGWDPSQLIRLSPARSTELCEHGLLLSVSVWLLCLEGRQLLDLVPTLIQYNLILTNRIAKTPCPNKGFMTDLNFGEHTSQPSILFPGAIYDFLRRVLAKYITPFCLLTPGPSSLAGHMKSEPACRTPSIWLKALFSIKVQIVQ